MNCKKCGGETWWLWMQKEVPERYIETDYMMCQDCEAVYKRVIHTEVEWLELAVCQEG